MNAFARIALASLVLAASASLAVADYPVLAPNPPLAPGQPSLGFSYTAIPGYGYRVDFVWYGSAAGQIGLEPGDIVRAINGHPLTYPGAHRHALQQAAYYGGWANLAIRDVRTGCTVYRWANLAQGAYYPYY